MAVQPIEVYEVSRWFGRGRNKVRALSEVSFSVEAGSVVALLGANGAGKTTITKILATLLVPSRGEARLHGHSVAHDVRECRRLASVVFGGERGLYPQLSGVDNLRFFGMLAGVGRREVRDRVPALMEELGLSEVASRRVETYSKGMKQRLHIAIGFISNPQILLLDEPTVGLDPMEADRLRSTIERARDDGAAVLLTSHYLLDVERLADRVLLLDRGRITENLSLPEFVQLAGYAATVTVRGRGRPPGLLFEAPDGVSLVGNPLVTSDEWQLILRVQEWSPSVLGRLTTLLAGADVHDMQVREAKLEEAFAQIAGGSR